MLCPIKINEHGVSQNCLETRCAWWDRSKSCCAVLSLAIKADFKEISNSTYYITKESKHDYDCCDYGGLQGGL